LTGVFYCGFDRLIWLNGVFFFLNDIFFQFYLLIFGWLEIKFHDLFWFAFYEIILVFFLSLMYSISMVVSLKFQRNSSLCYSFGFDTYFFITICFIEIIYKIRIIFQFYCLQFSIHCFDCYLFCLMYFLKMICFLQFHHL
jgi:hypothetical protein